MNRTWPFSLRLVLAVSLVAGASFAAHATPSKRAIDHTIERTMEAFAVPGMAVSVVYDGKVQYAEGHGVVRTGQADPVDDGTLFQIASLSKAFTAAALAVLADDGKLTLDDPVIDHVPEFRMYDAWVTREFTIRDMLTHRSGLPLGAGDLLLFPEGNATRQEIVHALRYLRPSSSFRSQYDYDNLMYIVAGVVVERVSGMPFEDFVEQRLLAPLGMNDCVALAARSSSTNKAQPHLLIDGEYQETDSLMTLVAAPAGGIACSARGMTHWISFVLNKGANENGEQVVSKAQFEQLVKPVTLTSVPGYLQEHAGAHLSAYALGWGVSTFYGEPALSHSGGLWGMTSFLMILPEQGLGVFASNNLMSAAPRAIVNQLVDDFLGRSNPHTGKDWIAIIDDVVNTRRDEGESTVAEAEAARAADSTPSLPLEAYTGTFRDPWYGRIHISLEQDGQLWFSSERNPPLHGPLEHFQYDTFIARWTDRKLMADAYVSFTLSPEGVADTIRMKAVSPLTDFSFDFHDLDLQRVESAE